DPDSPSHDKNFAKDKNVIVYCGSGGRSAFNGKLLKDMGYARVYNLGGFKDWAEAGGAVEKVSAAQKGTGAGQAKRYFCSMRMDRGEGAGIGGKSRAESPRQCGQQR